MATPPANARGKAQGVTRAPAVSRPSDVCAARQQADQSLHQTRQTVDLSVAIVTIVRLARLVIRPHV